MPLVANTARSDDRNPLDDEARLFSNVQFIYELTLAQLELRSLGAVFQMTDGFSSFKLLDVEDEARLRRRLAYFQTIRGQNTDYVYISGKNRTRSVNQYLTHWIYPYKGKFHPQMIRAALNIIGLEPGETVLDPFVGSGTTALEAQLLGVHCVGFDASPLCVLQSRVKTASHEVVHEIKTHCAELAGVKQADITLHEAAQSSTISSTTDQRVHDFFNLAELVALSDSVRRKRDVNAAFATKTKLMVQSISDYDQIRRGLGLSLGRAVIEQGDARALPLRDSSIDGIITSPPYAIALDYIKNDAHALQALGLDTSEIRERFIGLRGRMNDRVRLYDEDMKRSLEEMMRVLKPDRYALIVIGNAVFGGTPLRSVERIIEHASDTGLRLTKSIDKTIFGLYNVMQKEKVLIFKKDEESTQSSRA
ncbi:MAG: TRM11 family SAM-dependent methyltransferase [Halobacteriota archaeon]